MVLSVWWNFESITHFELVPNGQVSNTKLYYEELGNVYRVLENIYPDLVNHSCMIILFLYIVPEELKRNSNNRKEIKLFLFRLIVVTLLHRVICY